MGFDEFEVLQNLLVTARFFNVSPKLELSECDVSPILLREVFVAARMLKQ